LRRARALFSKSKVISKLRLVKLPVALPLDGVELEKRQRDFTGVAGYKVGKPS
jgi:hypothetical protein